MNTILANALDESCVDLAELLSLREKISLFGGLSDQHLRVLAVNLKAQNLAAGECVFQQGQLPCNIYIVLSGQVGFSVIREDNSTAKMQFRAGDCFGETAVIGIMPQLGRAETQTDARVMVMSRSCLMDIARIDAELFGVLMMNIAREVSRRLHSFVSTPVNAHEYPVLRAH